jgi:hypothetical protein
LVVFTYGKKAPGMTSHVKFPGAFLSKCSVWYFWGYLCLMRLKLLVLLQNESKNNFRNNKASL